MRTRQILKICIDAVMVILLPLLMAQILVGEVVHEWLGITMTLLFVVHHVLNHKWYGSLFRGHYTFVRVFGTVINILLSICICVLAASGILMSKHTVSALSINKGMSAWRLMHLLASHWGLALMSIHAGLHGSVMFGMVRKLTETEKSRTARIVILRILAVGIAGYGVYALMNWQVCSFLLVSVIMQQK